MRDLTAIDRERLDRIAEEQAREHRLNLDRVISAALDALDTRARQRAINGDDPVCRNAYLQGYTGVNGVVLSLIDEVKRGLSPLVR